MGGMIRDFPAAGIPAARTGPKVNEADPVPAVTSVRIDLSLFFRWVNSLKFLRVKEKENDSQFST
jgi:hypothetical protein